MSLSPEEKAAGRRFRDDAQAILAATFLTDHPTYSVPNFIGIYRHACAGRTNRSTALELKEIYLPSPAYQVSTRKGQIDQVVREDEPFMPFIAVPLEPYQLTRIPAGRFGFIYREGRCRSCGDTARSRAGRLIDGWERPPISGRVARG